MPPSGERIVSTSTGDILGSRWGRPTASSFSSPAPRRPAPQTTTATAPQQRADERTHNGGDIIGSRRAAAAATAAPPEPIVSTIDEGDIIGRRWVPTIDRPNSNNKQQLLSSRHATPSPHSRSPAPNRSTNTTTTTTDPAPAAGAGGQRQQTHQQLDKLKRLIDRLSWKSHTLVFTQSVALQSGAAMANAESSYAQPTTMFKLDFFEYYALLERILVLFLGFHRVPLPPASNKPNGSSTLLPISGKSGGNSWGHRYHESVLEALEGAKARGNGLEALGNEEVIAVLRRAKGFRNRWKDADEQVVPAWEWQREEVEELRLVELLEVVLQALERAYRGAEASLAGEVNGGGVGDGGETGKGTWLEVGGLQHGYVDEDMEDAPWEAVGDAMEDVMDMDMDVE